MNSDTAGWIEIGLNAAIVSVDGDAPQILAIPGGRADEPVSLPFGPFDPLRHRTFETGLRAFVSEQTALELGYVEQLYTFGDRGRHARAKDSSPHVVSVGYLALARTSEESQGALARSGAAWHPWYGFFPWEDWREGRPPILDEAILPPLRGWARGGSMTRPAQAALDRRERLRLSFGQEGAPWDEERTLDRYELLYEAGMVEEAHRDGRATDRRLVMPRPLGRSMAFDHRRILATAISRLRGKIKYRPVVFELLPAEFTLTELQRSAEAISGRHLHKQNFRRVVEGAALVEPTGRAATDTGGRPAALFRFRREVTKERPSPGLRLGQRG
jgi:hypothetical protein